MTEEQLYALLLVCSGDVHVITDMPEYNTGWAEYSVYIQGQSSEGEEGWTYRVDIPITVDPRDRQALLVAMAHSVVQDYPELVKGIVNNVVPLAITVFQKRDEYEQ